MALRERSGSRSVKGRHRAAPASARVAVPDQRTSHRWTSVEAEEWAARRARWVERIPAPRRAADPVVIPGPRRAGDEGGARGAVGGARIEAARVASAGLAGARLATAMLARATVREPGLRRADRAAARATVRDSEPGVQEPTADPWGRRPLPVRYRPLPRRRRRMTGLWILLAVLLVATVGAIPSALRDPAVRATANTGGPAVENLGGGAGGGGGPVAPAPAEFTDQLPDGRAQTAIDAALGQLGVPYQWGGNGPGAGDTGFDCSGLTAFAYAAAGIALPRTAHTQYVAGPHVPADAPLQPGDLVFYGSPSAVYHVGIYLGDGKMVNAPNYDQPVQVSHYRWRGDEYLGATRPAATGERRTGLLEYLPEPRTVEGWPRSFDAPRATVPAQRIQPSDALPAESATAAASIAAASLSAEGGAVERSPSTPATPAAGQPALTWTIPAARHQSVAQAAPAPSAPRVAAGLPAPGAVASSPALEVAAAATAPQVVDSPVPQIAAPAASPVAGSPVPQTAATATPPVAAEAPAALSPQEPAVAAGPPGAAQGQAGGTPPVPGAPGADPVVDAVVGTLTLPSGTIPLVAARLDLLGTPVVPAPGTAALLDEGGAQLLVLPTTVPVDDSVTVSVDGADPRVRTVVEAQTLTAAQLAEHVRTLPEGEFQIAAPAADGTWSVAELE
ncbi:Cell wall-associated hydrolase, NlpC family [Pseudonocardia oroxyli]|uniref:Cell wall-associated hydrolase, NlpC family n=1 Tax=Pseudonocardia oroxyli TaxID=366584 RepID=A0A1G7ZV83_PSEOR|nr:Cell wall-associated hydrolase, NlpC family [Pseudonocardia oroxyli]